MSLAERYRVNRDEYRRLGEAGILCDDARVELINGELIVMSPIGKRHATAVRIGVNLFVQRLAGKCIVECQNALNLSEFSEPQPDFLLLRSEMLRRVELASPADVLLLVEAAESSLGFDRGKKLQLYAQAGIPEVWIYNLFEGIIERYHTPEGKRYASMETFKKGERISPRAFPDVEFTVDELLP
jgi:Uma2 family endonuclease